MKKLSVLTIAFGTFLVALDLGASAPQEAATDTGPITLSVWTEAGQINDELQPMFDLYTTQHPNVTFKVSAFEMQNLNDIVPAALASGAEDLDFLFLIGHADAQSFGEKGLLLDLTQYYEQFNWYDQQYPGAAKELTAGDGNLYFLSIDFVMYGINYFNSEIFDSVGVAAPAALEDLFTISDKLSGADYDTWAIGNKWSWTIRQLSESLALRLIPDDVYQTLVNWRNLSAQQKRENLELMKSDGVLEVFRFLKRMTEEGMFIDGFNTLDDGAGRLAFTEQRAAVYSSGSWAVGLINSEAPELALDYFLMPEHAGNTTFPASYANSLTIPAYTSGNKLDAIVDFFNNMLQPDYAKFSFDAGLISSSTNLSEADIAANVDPLTARLIMDNADKGGVVTHFSNWPQELAAGAWDIAAQEVTAFTMTPEEAVEFIHSAAQKNIQ